MDLDDIPPIRSQSDLHGFWRALMGPLGFSRRTLWMVFIDRTGHVEPSISPIDDIPAQPDEQGIAHLFWVCEQVIDAELEPGSRVAFLLSRPGTARITDDDLAWARSLRRRARKAIVACEMLHLATDDDLVVIAPDDLAESA